MSNLRFGKVFVLSNVGTKFVTDNTKKPRDLASGQVGLHTVTTDGIIGVGVGATPGASLQALQIHQNVGDSKFGTVRSKTIERALVRDYYKASASNAQTAIHYIGYDTVDGTKTITSPCGKEFSITVGLWDNRLNNWYMRNPSYRKTIVINSGVCNVNNDPADADAIADFIIAQINNTGQPANDFPAQTELPNFVTATKVSTGTAGQSDYRVGVRIETKAQTVQLLNACEPVKFAEVNMTQVVVSVDANRDSSIVVPVTEFRVAKPGSGYPAFVAADEAESQGYDRVPEVFDHPKYMKLSNYVIYAQDVIKYDHLFLAFNYETSTPISGASSRLRREPYLVTFIAPTGTLQPVADVLNSWLTGLRPAVTF